MRILFSLFIILLGFSTNASSQQYQHDKISFLGRWDDTTIISSIHADNRYSGIWGYAVDGREYAIIGGSNGAHIINITDPANPVRIQFVPGTIDECTWREYKTYGHYLYMSSDDPGNNTFQIADLSYLPDSVHVVFSSSTDNSDSVFIRSHTIFIEGDKLYSGISTYKNGYQSAMTVYSLANPEWPTLIADVKRDGYSLTGVHDMYVEGDTVYASCGLQGLFVFKLHPTHFQALGVLSQYNFAGYNHSSCLIDSGRHMVMLDEVPEALPIKVIKINGPNDMDVVDTLSTQTGATPHNPFVCENNRVAIAYYEDGLQIYDFTNPENPVRSGYFDTHFQTDFSNNTGAYKGAWGAYTGLPSKRIIVSDMQNGLFVLDADSALGITRTTIIDTTISDTIITDTTILHISERVPSEAISLYPNPVTDILKVKGIGEIAIDRLIITDLQGRCLKEVTVDSNNISISELSKGYYFLYVYTHSGVVVKQFVKQ